MTLEKLYNIVARTFDVPIDQINDMTSPENIKNWDSFNGYILLDEIENEFDVKFSLDEALEITNVGDFKKLLEKQGITFNPDQNQ